MAIGSRSPRSTQPYHTDARSPRRTRPVKVALGAIQASRPTSTPWAGIAESPDWLPDVIEAFSVLGPKTKPARLSLRKSHVKNARRAERSEGAPGNARRNPPGGSMRGL